MWPDRVSNPGPLTYESGALPTALHSPAHNSVKSVDDVTVFVISNRMMVFYMYICTKFHENIPKGFRVIEWTRFVTGRQTDRQTTMGNTICSPPPPDEDRHNFIKLTNTQLF